MVLANILQEKFMNGYSLFLRYDDLRIGFLAIKEHPILGLGFGDLDYRMSYISKERINIVGDISGGGTSSDFATTLASGGIYFMAYYICGLCGLSKYGNSRYSRLILLLLWFIFIISRIGQSLLFFLFVTFGVVCFFEKQEKQKSIAFV